MASSSSNPFGAGSPFGIPGMQMPGDEANAANPVLQSMEMLRQVWNSFGALSQNAPVSPAMGLDELDRRIADLRAVENWLNLNLTMLRGTIQGLEVQRATISTLRSFAQSATGDSAKGDAPSANPWWNMLQEQFNIMTAAATPKAADAPKPAAKPARKAPARKTKA